MTSSTTTPRAWALRALALVLVIVLAISVYVAITSFRDVRAQFGPPRLATLPIGAYEPRWFMRPQHVDPGEAVEIARILEADQALGHHWGTFQLTDEGVERPAEDLAAALSAAGMAPERFLALRPGQVWQA